MLVRVLCLFVNSMCISSKSLFVQVVMPSNNCKKVENLFLSNTRAILSFCIFIFIFAFFFLQKMQLLQAVFLVSLAFYSCVWCVSLKPVSMSLGTATRVHLRLQVQNCVPLKKEKKKRKTTCKTHLLCQSCFVFVLLKKKVGFVCWFGNHSFSLTKQQVPAFLPREKRWYRPYIHQNRLT